MGDKRDYQGRIFSGLLIILIGVIFLFGSLGKLDIGEFFSKYWPLILIFLGLWHLASNNFRFSGVAVFLIVIGVFFQLMEWGILGGNVWNILWPSLIIVLGLWLILRPRFRGAGGKVPRIRDDDLGIFILFAGIKRRFESSEFRGGKATALFGGIELDLNQTKLKENEATVELTAIFGGIDVWVPKDWKVVVDSSAIFGGVDDKHNPVPQEEIKATLFIKATAIFGGIGIKN